MDKNIITVFVVAGNSQGEPEILAYDIAAYQDELAYCKHYDAAKSKASEDGYEVVTCFDSNDLAGRQLLGIKQMYGDFPRFPSEIKAQI